MATIKVLGLGSGRCGTLSLATFLNIQRDSIGFHETVPGTWEPHSLEVLDQFPHHLVSETGSYHLLSWPQTRGIKAICLRRNREETIRSFAFNLGLMEQNHWSEGQGTGSPWDKRFPKFPLPRLEAIGAYYDHYYSLAESFVSLNFRIFPTEMLSDIAGQAEILDFIGLEENYRVFFPGLCMNKGVYHSSVRDYDAIPRL